MPGFDERHLDATVADLERLAGQRDETPSWLTGLIAKHGQPLVVRGVHDNDSRTEYAWPHLHVSVRVGCMLGAHYVVAIKGTRSEQLIDTCELTDADISAVVALAGLCDAASRCGTCGGNSVIACHGAYPGGPTACIDCHPTGEMTCPACRGAS